ncbi:MAG: hypothetical protein ACE5JT_01635 [Nitrosopumilaceae archaeon]
MKIKCPKCKDVAELADDFSFVRCPHCSLDMSYGEYVRLVAHIESTYSDVLGDYAGGGTEGASGGSLDDWD